MHLAWRLQLHLHTSNYFITDFYEVSIEEIHRISLQHERENELVEKMYKLFVPCKSRAVTTLDFSLVVEWERDERLVC